MRSLLSLLFLLALAATSATQGATAAARSQRAAGTPRLVVVIVIDQMRGDVLTRYAGYFHGGLHRLRIEGRAFTEAHHDHAFTVTAAGHATISTGCRPATTGIVGNDLVDRSRGEAVYSTADPSTVIVDSVPGTATGQSPWRLRRPALGEWLKASSPASKVFSVAFKDRSAVFMGGLHPDGAFWYQEATGHFVTSSYYAKALPAWARTFNDEGRVEAASRAPWTRLLSEDSYLISSEDAVATEADCVHTTFPHGSDPDAADAASAFRKGIWLTPFGDEMAVDFAERIVTEERLGQDSAPDILWLGLSTADYIGHAFGPLSPETQDYYVRIDRKIGDFLDFLDRRVGRGRYVVALSSDHGVMPLPEDVTRRGYPGQRVVLAALAEAAGKVFTEVQAELGLSKPIGGPVLVSGVVLDTTEAESKGIPASEVRRRVAAKLRLLPYIADAMTSDELAALPAPSDRPYLQLYRNSFSLDRSPDVTVRPKEFALIGWKACGTSHGTPYRYDTHVPLLFWGTHVPAGEVRERVRTIDLAPTLASLLRIRVPDGVEGVALPVGRR